MNPESRFGFVYFALAVLALLAFQAWLGDRGHVRTVAYSEFEQLLAQGEIAEVTIAGERIEGTLKEARNGRAQHVVAQRVEPAIAERLRAAGVPYRAVAQSSFWRDLASWVVPTLLFVGVWIFVLRRFVERGGGDGLMAIGRSKARVYVEQDTKVTFADVAGVDEAKAELQEIVQFLKQPQAYGRLGARLPHGILLVGPPGTGKTLLARAVAGEAGVPFFSINGSEFVEMFVGVGAARVRDLFTQASGKAPAIIFIDELDALGRARGAFPLAGGHDEKEQTLNQLLSEMDGFDPRQGLVLLAATNRPEILDPALLRAGRFDRQVLVDRPDKQGRAQILAVHTRKLPLAADVSPAEIGALTPGFSGAELANLVNEAALLATRRDAAEVAAEDFTRAIERIVAGLEKKNRLLNPHEREVVAYHELGHAFVAMSLDGANAIHKVSIIPRGIGALGYTIQRPTEDRYLMSRAELENKMAMLLGGRAAEHAVFAEVSTGAADDLARATDIARSMVTRYGMVPALGQVAYEEDPHGFLGSVPGFEPAPRYSEDSARRIDQAVRELVDHAFNHALAVLRPRRARLDAAAQALLHRETLTEAELRTLYDGEAAGAPPTPAPNGPATPTVVAPAIAPRKTGS